MKKETLVSLFISFIMVTSVLGFVIGDFSSNAVKYNGRVFRFSQDDNLYHADINGGDVGFYYFPENVRNVNISSAFFDSLLATKVVYFTADFNDSLIESISLVSYDFSKIVDGYLYVIPAYTTNATKLPAVSCANATEFVPVVYFRQGDSVGSSFEKNCLVLSVSSEYDVLSFRDRILYGYFGVI
jgi:hypothetical protein